MVGCIGVSEPGAGSDVAAIKSHARKDGDDYVITGQKMWITNSLQADWMCMLVNTGDGARESAQEQEPGHGADARRTKRQADQGHRGGAEDPQDRHELQRHRADLLSTRCGCRSATASAQEGAGFIYQMQQFQEERLWAAASCLQSLTNCIDWTVEWAQERKLFGATLADQQWVQFKLAEMKTEVESLRALTYRACELYVQGQDVTGAGIDGQAQGRAPEPHRARRLPAVLGRHGLHAGEQGLAHVPRRAAGLDWRRCGRSDAGHLGQDHGHCEEATQASVICKRNIIITCQLLKNCSSPTVAKLRDA